MVGGNNKGFAVTPGPRSFVVIATDERGNWRVKDVTAVSHVEAERKYKKVFPYQVIGVGLLGGSGHPIKWTHYGSSLPTLPQSPQAEHVQ